MHFNSQKSYAFESMANPLTVRYELWDENKYSCYPAVRTTQRAKEGREREITSLLLAQ